jgi:hypothetical protein
MNPGTPVDWFHYTWWMPIGIVLGWAVLYRTKPSIKTDFAIVGTLVFVISFLATGLYSDHWTGEREDKAQVEAQFQDIADHYPELSNWSWSVEGEDKIVRVYFTDPEGDRCEGPVDGDSIYDVTCRDTYDPDEGKEG